MIQSFADPETELLFREEKSRRYASIARAALRKLIQLNQAANLKDLAVPPGNRLEALQGKRKGEHSIRINQQWRLVFVWGSQGPEMVKIEDYH
jgi:toxin HigB-1